MEKDPICGMEVDRLSAIKASKAGQEYFFVAITVKINLSSKKILRVQGSAVLQ